MTWTQTNTLPKAILHVDADAFFASCEQVIHPHLKGKPVITGYERGVATSISYEAKGKGVKRGMTMSEIKRICPNVIIVNSDYETYALFSKRMFTIMRRFDPNVEEYSIDEGFMDITGSQRNSCVNYQEVARTIKRTIQQDLGITVSVGLAPTKVLAKLASQFNKPDGYACINMKDLPDYLRDFSIDKIWGVGKNTALYMRGLNIFTAYDFAIRPREFIYTYFDKPQQEIWHELNGRMAYPVISEEKTSYASISKTETFSPTSSNKETVYAELVKNIEKACDKARHHNLAPKRISIFLKDANFQFHGLDAELNRISNYPTDIIPGVRKLFEQIYCTGVKYRTTGAVLSNLQEATHIQSSLFDSPLALQKVRRVYQAIDKLSAKFSPQIVHVASSLKARINNPLHQKQKTNNTIIGDYSFKKLNIPIISAILR